jgi:hypothetical protein
MGERATPLLIATFIGGVGWGAWLAPSLGDSSSGPRAVAKVTEVADPISTFRDVVKPQLEPTLDAEPSQIKAIEEQVDEVDDFDHEEEIGISAADAILALEQRYQELLRQLTPLADQEDEQELEEIIADSRLSQSEDVVPEPEEQAPAIAAAEPPSDAPTFQQGEGQQYAAEVINIHNQHDLSETNNQVVVVQSQLPYYGGVAAGTVLTQTDNASTAEQVARTSSPYAPWAERRASQTNPWAPIDYSTHHNPYSLMISGKSSTLPREGGSGLSVIYRR